MLGKHRFYCPECKRFLDRRKVTADPFEELFYCKFHEVPVIQTKYVLFSWLEEVINKIIEKGAEDEFL